MNGPSILDLVSNTAAFCPRCCPEDLFLANAFGRTGNTIAFTDFLLQRMSRPEVNYVLGHELTHFKLKHPGKIAAARVVSMFGAFFVVGMAVPFGMEWPLLRYGVILAIVTFFPLFWSRRFEYAADAGAVKLTGDPRAAISALSSFRV
jgi:Zn-dependent protease with chaperone function